MFIYTTQIHREELDVEDDDEELELLLDDELEELDELEEEELLLDRRFRFVLFSVLARESSCRFPWEPGAAAEGSSGVFAAVKSFATFEALDMRSDMDFCA